MVAWVGDGQQQDPPGATGAQTSSSDAGERSSESDSHGMAPMLNQLEDRPSTRRMRSAPQLSRRSSNVSVTSVDSEADLRTSKSERGVLNWYRTKKMFDEMQAAQRTLKDNANAEQEQWNEDQKRRKRKKKKRNNAKRSRRKSKTTSHAESKTEPPEPPGQRRNHEKRARNDEKRARREESALLRAKSSGAPPSRTRETPDSWSRTKELARSHESSKANGLMRKRSSTIDAANLRKAQVRQDRKAPETVPESKAPDQSTSKVFGLSAMSSMLTPKQRNQKSNMRADVIMMGPLWKEGRAFGYKKLYFVLLRSGILSYYQTKLCKELVGSISCNDIIDVVPHENEGILQKDYIDFSLMLNSEREYRLRIQNKINTAYCELEMATWLAAITFCFNGACPWPIDAKAWSIVHTQKTPCLMLYADFRRQKGLRLPILGVNTDRAPESTMIKTALSWITVKRADVDPNFDETNGASWNEFLRTQNNYVESGQSSSEPEAQERERPEEISQRVSNESPERDNSGPSVGSQTLCRFMGQGVLLAMENGQYKIQLAPSGIIVTIPTNDLRLETA